MVNVLYALKLQIKLEIKHAISIEKGFIALIIIIFLAIFAIIVHQ